MYDCEEVVKNPNIFAHELLHLATPKEDLFRGKPFAYLAIATKMEKTGQYDPTGTFSSLYSKDKTAFGDSFPYGDMFTREPYIVKKIRKECKQFGIEVPIRNIWSYNKQPDILLVNTPGFHFLTTKNQLATDILNYKANHK